MSEEEKTIEEKSEDQVRTVRSANDREVTQRVESWENPSNLPSPDPQPGWVFRYIRTSLLGNTDNPNVSKKFREGWIPCKSEDHPQGKKKTFGVEFDFCPYCKGKLYG